VLPGRPLLPLTPPLPGMPAIVESFSDDFRSLYQNDFRLFTVKTFGHLSDRCKKIKRYEAFMMGHYIPNKVFVSGCRRQGGPMMFALSKSAKSGLVVAFQPRQQDMISLDDAVIPRCRLK